ncbi:hypothetical protein GGX14DRAFT_565837 [Mycena pura]|uniref:Uncharacterized protein n=1 Tax=Mycena pura TaxID=153505 RepID=A0AAD6YAD1_9AGAR|nr:hypothetical protein GGX14DRAFT_565837 [Mycena pura]
MPRTTTFVAFLASVLLGVATQKQPHPTLCDFKCHDGQFLVGGEAKWALTGSNHEVAVNFMSNFCNASIGNTALNCTGNALGSTRRVLQANSVYITEQLQKLTLTHGTLSQVVISTDPDVYNEGTWTYIDYSHLSDIQVYNNHSTGVLSGYQKWPQHRRTAAAAVVQRQCSGSASPNHFVAQDWPHV